MTKATVKVKNAEGFYARPATYLVEVCNHFKSAIWLCVGERIVNGKSLLGVLSQGVKLGDEVLFKAEGSDEKEAIETVTKLIDSKFDDIEDILRIL